MQFRLSRDVFSDAVQWTSRAVQQRPTIPILSAVKISARENEVEFSTFDYEVSARSRVEAVVTEAGEALVSGRLITEIVTGEALFRKMTATLSELGTKKMLVELAVENIIKACWQIENPDSEMIDFVIKFADGLPTSEAEKIDNILKKNGNEPIISMADAIKEAYPGISDEEVDDTIAKIQEQRGLGNSLTNSEVI